MDPVTNLPLEVLVEIFVCLQGRSLQNARLVSTIWNNFILDHIWLCKMSVKKLEKSLERNWREAEYHEETPLYYDLPFTNCRIEDASSQFVAIKNRCRNLRNTRIAIFSLEDRSFWQIPVPFRSVFKKAQSNDFHLSLSNKFVAIRVPLKPTGNCQNLQVYSLENRNKVICEYIQGLYQVELSRTDYHPELIVLFTKTAVLLWSVKENKITKTYIEAEYSQFVSTCFINGFVVNSIYFEQADLTKIMVWEIDPIGVQITIRARIEDLYNFFHKNKKRVHFHVNEITWIADTYVVACIIPNAPGLVNTSSLCVRVVKETGEILKEVKFLECFIDSEMSYFIYNQRLIISIEHQNYILQGNIKDLIKNTDLHFQPIKHLPGRCPLMINKVVANASTIVNFWGGYQMLKIREAFIKKNHKTYGIS